MGGNQIYLACITFGLLVGMILGGVSWVNKRRERHAARIDLFIKTAARVLLVERLTRFSHIPS
jgi:Na+/glutamate symporter